MRKKSNKQLPKGRSGFESRIRDSLDKRKVKYSYEPVDLPYEIPGKYKPDFVLGTTKKSLTVDQLADKIIVEVKGYLDADTRKKMIAVKKAHPQLDIRFVFQNDGFVYKNKKAKRRNEDSTDMRYSDWCKKYGFLYAFDAVPEDWIRN